MAETVKLSKKSRFDWGSDPPMESLPSCVTYGEINRSGGKKTYQWFCCILYPQDDEKHRKFMSYIDTDRGLFPYHVYIWHDRDLVSPVDREEDVLKGNPPREVGSLKKPHIHFIFKRSVKCPVSTVSSYFLPWVKQFYAVTNFDDYIRYCVHCDPKSIDDDYKFKYGFLAFQGDTQVLKRSIIQNANSVLFFDLFNLISSSETGTLREFIENLKGLDPVISQEYFDCYKNNQYIFNRLFMEISRQKEDEAYAESFFAPGWQTDKGDGEGFRPWKENYYYNAFVKKTIINGFDPDKLQRG